MLTDDTCAWEAAGFSVVRASDALRPEPAFTARLTSGETATLRTAHKPYDDLGPDLWRGITDVIRRGSALVCQIDVDTARHAELLLTSSQALAAAQAVAAALPPPPPLRAASPVTPLPTRRGVHLLVGDLAIGLEWLRSEVVSASWTCPRRLAATVDDIARALLALRLHLRVLPDD